MIDHAFALVLLIGGVSPSPQSIDLMPPPIQLAQSFISTTDYPAEARRRGEQGRAEFEVDISPEGRVVGCRITRSSGSESLDRATCDIMRERARFRPARDSAGNPVPDVFRSGINWRLTN